MNRIQSFFNCQHGIAKDFTYDFALRRLCVAKEDSWRGILPSNYSSDYNPEPPIFSAKFAKCDGYRHILAIANEDGKIALQDTTKRNCEPEERALNAPQCHYNAVFDLEWAPGQMKFVSASGDHTASLWQVDGSEIRKIRTFVGHTRSVKTAAFRRHDPTVFATGGRDGAIIIWDTRANLNVDLTPRADNCIFSGHVGGPGTPVSQKKRTRTPKMAPNATSSSITGLAFQDTNTLISCGAGDGVIKVWDLRRNYTAYKKEPHPKHSLPYAGTSTFKGFTNLIIDESGSRLYANCMDNTIYTYNLCSYSAKPLERYKGLLNSTFYIKACLSPDGKYLLSGSSDEKAFIWNLNYPDEPLVALYGHTVEVTCVAWGSTHDQPIVTCSDDARHKIWRIGPEHISDTERVELYRGHAEYVRQFSRKSHGSTHKYNLRDLESTPRSLKRLMEQNERTPGSMEKVTTKRSFLEMLGAVAGTEGADESEPKRHKSLESRGRRLFSPCTSTMTSSSSNSTPPQVRCITLQLSSIPEECNTSPISSSPLSTRTIQTHADSNQENTMEPTLPYVSLKVSHPTTPSPLSERAVVENHNHIMYISPPNASSTGLAATSSMNGEQQQPASLSSIIFSPTSNLPNYVLDGEAPHLSIMSPKRKHKEKVDWLTKIRKQKLMSSRNATLSEKISDDCGSGDVPSVSSPRLQSLRQNGSSPRVAVTPRRRMSSTSSTLTHGASSPSASGHQQQHHHQHQHQHHPKTPTSSRRNSETTILRFFSVRSQRTETVSLLASADTDSGVMRSLQPLPSSPTSSSSMTNSAGTFNPTMTHAQSTTCTE